MVEDVPRVLLQLHDTPARELEEGGEQYGHHDRHLCLCASPVRGRRVGGSVTQGGRVQ